MSRIKDKKERQQVITPRARKVRRARVEKRRVIKLGDVIAAVSSFAKPIALVTGVVLLIVAYNVLANSRAFQLRTVTIVDAAPSVRDDVDQIVRRIVGATGLEFASTL